MKSRWKKYLAAGLLTAGVLSLTGCHGAKEEKSFELPDTFDTSKNYELTFWAKNDTKRPRPISIRRQFLILRPFTQTSR